MTLKQITFKQEALRANYFADDEFRNTVCEIVKSVPDGYWITLLVESPQDIEEVASQTLSSKKK